MKDMWASGHNIIIIIQLIMLRAQMLASYRASGWPMTLKFNLIGGCLKDTTLHTVAYK